jgi:hypothetical protein
MKKHILLFLLISLTIGIGSASFAQNAEREFLLDIGIGYGNEIEAPGIKGGGVYQINEMFRGAANLFYFLPGEDSYGVDFNWLEFNLNGHYLFVNQENTNVYLLSGLNFTKLSADENIRLPSGDSTDKVYVGLNIGAGADFSLGSINAFVEGKYALSSAHQLVMSAGLRIPIGN